MGRGVHSPKSFIFLGEFSSKSSGYWGCQDVAKDQSPSPSFCKEAVQEFRVGSADDLPSGKHTKNYGKIHHFEWEKSTINGHFQW